MIANGTCGCHPRFIWEVDRIFPACDSKVFGELRGLWPGMKWLRYRVFGFGNLFRE